MTEPEAGSALTDLKTRAVLNGDHYVVNGQNRFITGGGESDVYLVYVRMTDEPGARGIGGLVMEKGTPGFTFGKQERFMGLTRTSRNQNLAVIFSFHFAKMFGLKGLRGMPSCDLLFDNCRVPKENLVVRPGEFKKLMQAFDIERLGNTTMSLGIADGALEQAVRYSQERKQFGRPIFKF